jgi:hypothetical protein
MYSDAGWTFLSYYVLKLNIMFEEKDHWYVLSKVIKFILTVQN